MLCLVSNSQAIAAKPKMALPNMDAQTWRLGLSRVRPKEVPLGENGQKLAKEHRPLSRLREIRVRDHIPTSCTVCVRALHVFLSSASRLKFRRPDSSGMPSRASTAGSDSRTVQNMKYRRGRRMRAASANIGEWDVPVQLLVEGCTRSELVNCANGPLLQHENFLNIRGVSPEQEAIRHQTMATAKINQSGSFDVR
ncbi:hypothetical protein EVAR_47322_1 [Eumeta japonica]|uniref:Uncharacterized protein n=1 Tax=Eumeta variegata TaxID=151549 RepID=A0A4C1YLR5_EUMVA|nr:hypothetical protein EVAR_47322_1 [Eumeta japonica]